MNQNVQKKESELSIVLVRKEETPVIHFRLLLLSGSAHDPEGKEGLAHLTSHLMKRGTASFSRNEIEETLDFIASDISISCQKDLTIFSGRTLVQNLETFYRLFLEVLLQPTFPEEELEKLKVDQVDIIESIRENDEALVREAFNNWIYEDHPYGHLDAGHISSIKKLTREDVLNFYHKHFRKGNILLGMAGAVSDSFLSRVKDDVSSFPSGARVSRDDKRGVIPARRKVLVIEKEGRTQTQMRIGHPLSITRKDSDYFPLLLANNYLGKHRVSTGRLYQEIREKRGLSYGAYSYIEHFLGLSGPLKLPVLNLARREQYFSMWVYSKNENAKFVMKLALKEMSELVERGLEDEALHEVKNYTVNNFPFEVETPVRKLAMMLDDEIYGSKHFAETFGERIMAVTSRDVKKVLKETLYPDRVAIVALVSEGQRFIEEILSPETKLEYPSGFHAKDLQKEDHLIKNFSLNLEREDFEMVKASDLFQ